MKHHLILRIITKILIAPTLLFALYVQFHGDFGPGGGFQAGVIFSSAFVLYALVFGLEEVQKVAPPSLVLVFAAIGVLLYGGVGYASFFFGGEFLNYSVFIDPHHPHYGQHLGIILVELGVLITVAAVMIAIFYAFAGHIPEPQDKDW